MGDIMGIVLTSGDQSKNTVESAYWFSDCNGATGGGGWEPGLNQAEFYKKYQYNNLFALLSQFAKDYAPESGDYAYIYRDFEAIKRISNEDTQLTQMINLRQRIAEQCNNNNNPKCASIKEFLDVYKKCMEIIDSEWNSYDGDLEKARMEAHNARAGSAFAEEKCFSRLSCKRFRNNHKDRTALLIFDDKKAL
jgi:hypothetical protein